MIPRGLSKSQFNDLLPGEDYQERYSRAAKSLSNDPNARSPLAQGDHRVEATLAENVPVSSDIRNHFLYLQALRLKSEDAPSRVNLAQRYRELTKNLGFEKNRAIGILQDEIIQETDNIFHASGQKPPFKKTDLSKTLLLEVVRGIELLARPSRQAQPQRASNGSRKPAEEKPQGSTTTKKPEKEEALFTLRGKNGKVAFDFHDLSSLTFLKGLSASLNPTIEKARQTILAESKETLVKDETRVDELQKQEQELNTELDRTLALFVNGLNTNFLKALLAEITTKPNSKKKYLSSSELNTRLEAFKTGDLLTSQKKGVARMQRAFNDHLPRVNGDLGNLQIPVFNFSARVRIKVLKRIASLFKVKPCRYFKSLQQERVHNFPTTKFPEEIASNGSPFKLIEQMNLAIDPILQELDTLQKELGLEKLKRMKIKTKQDETKGRLTSKFNTMVKNGFNSIIRVFPTSVLDSLANALSNNQSTEAKLNQAISSAEIDDQTVETAIAFTNLVNNNENAEERKSIFSSINVFLGRAPVTLRKISESLGLEIAPPLKQHAGKNKLKLLQEIINEPDQLLPSLKAEISFDEKTETLKRTKTHLLGKVGLTKDSRELENRAQALQGISEALNEPTVTREKAKVLNLFTDQVLGANKNEREFHTFPSTAA